MNTDKLDVLSTDNNDTGRIWSDRREWQEVATLPRYDAIITSEQSS